MYAILLPSVSLCLMGINASVAKAPITESTEGLAMINGNSLVPFMPPVYLQAIKYEKLISCLSFCESSNNSEIIGDNGKAKGILQFWQSTFEHYCVNKYQFANDIFNSEIQRHCADLMLQENFNNIYHWTNCWNYCKNRH